MQLAVDGTNNVYAADPSNGRVVRIYNAQTAVMEGNATIGSGFTKPSAVAVDNSGDVKASVSELTGNDAFTSTWVRRD